MDFGHPSNNSTKWALHLSATHTTGLHGWVEVAQPVREGPEGHLVEQWHQAAMNCGFGHPSHNSASRALHRNSTDIKGSHMWLEVAQPVSEGPVGHLAEQRNQPEANCGFWHPGHNSTKRALHQNSTDT